jgi:hypothetical protein
VIANAASGENMFYTDKVSHKTKVKPKLINSLVNPACHLQITATNKSSPHRNAIESFIKQGYREFYGAKITVNTPYLISLSKGNLKSALGVRSATSSLFIEQYLHTGIESKLAELGKIFERHQIAEIAHLYSNAKTFTLPLLLVTAASLKLKGFEVMAFTGTQHIIRLIEKTGIKVRKLAKANPSLLSTSNNNWGRYYDSDPVVAYIQLSDVLEVIEATPKLAYMFSELMPQVANLVLQLADI